MGPDAKDLIRAGSGIALAAVGVLTLWLNRRGAWAGARPLGIALLGLGLGFLGVNLLKGNEAAFNVSSGVQVLGFAAWTVGLALFVLRGPWSSESRRLTLAVLLAGGCVSGILALGIQERAAEIFRLEEVPGSLTLLRIVLGASRFVHGAALAVGFLAAFQVRRGNQVERNWSVALFALGIMAYSAYLALPISPAGASLIEWIVFPAALAVVLAAWLGNASVAPRPSWTVVCGVLAIGTLSQVTRVFFPAFGTIGIVRTMAALVLGLVVMRGGLWGAARPLVRIPATALAAGALAVLFIIAQVAQNFLSAEYGLLAGGVLAGVFLFVASPLQRAFEAMRTPKPRYNIGPDTTRNGEAAYRGALRLSLRDRHLSAKERLDLARLADELGLTARRAAELEAAVGAQMRKRRRRGDD